MSNQKNAAAYTDEDIASAACEAVLSCDGIYGMSPGIGAILQKSLLGRESVFNGLKLGKNNDDKISIDCYIIVNYGTNIPALVWKLQESVKKAVESKTNAKISAVNVHVQGVRQKEGRQRTNA